MVSILFHLQVNVANGHLLLVLMLENQHAIGNFQLADIKGPAGIGRIIRQSIFARRNRRTGITHGFGLRGELDHRAFQHHLLNLQLMGNERDQRHIKAHVVCGHQRLGRPRRRERHAARENAELRPDVPAQRPVKLQLITTARLDLPHHVSAEIVGVNQQNQRRKASHQHHQQNHQRCQNSSHGILNGLTISLYQYGWQPRPAGRDILRPADGCKDDLPGLTAVQSSTRRSSCPGAAPAAIYRR